MPKGILTERERERVMEQREEEKGGSEFMGTKRARVFRKCEGVLLGIQVGQAESTRYHANQRRINILNIQHQNKDYECGAL